MKKINIKGFTLIELLAVIVVLGIIAIIGVMSVSSVIETSKDKAYEQQAANIVKASKEWAVEHTEKLPNSDSTFVTVSDLVNSGKLAETPTNPKTGGLMNGKVIISCSNAACVSYNYKYVDPSNIFDLNGDNKEDCNDFYYMINNFTNSNPIFDLNDDGVINPIDLSIALEHFNCPATPTD